MWAVFSFGRARVEKVPPLCYHASAPPRLPAPVRHCHGAEKASSGPTCPRWDTFELNRRIYEIDEDAYRRTLDELTGLLDVRALLQVQVRRLSLGERMMMELIAALLHRPDILYLDEPTIGLDILSSAASAIFSNITTNRRAPRFC